MARTGISIKVSNTTFGTPPNVDGNCMLVVAGATPVATGSIAFVLDVPYLLRSADDLKELGIVEETNRQTFSQVNDFYAKNPSGLLWLVGTETNTTATSNLAENVRATVVQGFQYRPRNIGISPTPMKSDGVAATDIVDPSEVQIVIDKLYNEGFATVAIVGGEAINGSIVQSSKTLPDLSLKKSPMVGVVIVTNRQKDVACVGHTLGFMSTLSVATSIGDASLQHQGDAFYFIDYTLSSDGGASKVSWINTPCARVNLDTLNALGDKQYIFMRTRPPRNGLWFNDGATADEAATALSTLEAGRTLASLVDELRSFFSPYLNSRVPVNNTGNIDSAYKEALLTDARALVISPYIQNGDISDARIDLKAKNDDMVGTRTWEITLSVLGAPTLRWIDGFVFYVKSL